MAQSAESTMSEAVSRIRSSVFRVALPANTSSIRFCNCPSPTRQGTHLPQVWAWHIFRKESCRSTGHNPGGLAIILLSRSLYRRSTVSCALFGVAIFNRLIIFSILRADACVTFMPCATGAAGNGYGVLLSVCGRGVLLTRTMALATWAGCLLHGVSAYILFFKK